MPSTIYTPTTLLKPADDGLLAHIYEHVAANYINKTLHDAGFKFIVDYNLWAKTYGSTCFIQIQPYSDTISKYVQVALGEFSASQLSLESINQAAIECSLEYGRTIRAIDEAKLLGLLENLHASNWLTMTNFTADQATEQSSVNTVFSNSGISYKNKNSATLEEVTLHFQLSHNAYGGNPSKKALAVLLVQAFALECIEALGQKYNLYDNGDEWHEGAEDVAYRVHVVFQNKSTPSTKDIEQALQSEYTKFNVPATYASMTNLLTDTYLDESLHYFSIDAMNRITDGIIIGSAGWRSVSSADTVSYLFKHLTVSAVRL